MSTGRSVPLPAAAELPAEDQARVNFYALLACLFYDAPDRELLGALAAADEIVAEGEDSALALAWRDLTLAAAACDEEAAQREYFDLFIGTGKAELSPYAGAYVQHSAFENPLVALRGFLAAHGLARRASARASEFLCRRFTRVVGRRSGS